MAKLTIGEICEKLDILTSLENKLRNGNDLNEIDREEAAEMLSDYADLLLGIKIDI